MQSPRSTLQFILFWVQINSPSKEEGISYILYATAYVHMCTLLYYNFPIMEMSQNYHIMELLNGVKQMHGPP